MNASGAVGIAPIFELLGTGQLAGDALDALVEVLEAEGLPMVSAARLERARQIAAQRMAVTVARPAVRQPGLIERTLAAFEESDVVRRLTAALVLDLRPRMLPAGARSVGAAGCRLLFAVDGYEVMLQGSPVVPMLPPTAGPTRRRGHDLAGQILRGGEPVASAFVQLAGTGNPVAEAEADGEGCFRFPGLAVDRYVLDVWAGNDLIVCAPIMLGELSA